MTNHPTLALIRQWLALKTARGDHTVYTDVDHSAFLQRVIVEGKLPLPHPPPLAHGHPWYELMDVGWAMVRGGDLRIYAQGESPPWLFMRPQVHLYQAVYWITGRDGAAYLLEWPAVRPSDYPHRFRLEVVEPPIDADHTVPWWRLGVVGMVELCSGSTPKVG